MEFTSLDETEDWLTYPTNRVIGSLSTTEDLTGAITDLNTAGFGREQVFVLGDEKGASRLDVTGEQHGLPGRISRIVAQFGDMDLALLKDYKEELLSGHFLVAIQVKNEEERKRVAAILVSNGGHRVNFFGRWTIHELGA